MMGSIAEVILLVAKSKWYNIKKRSRQLLTGKVVRYALNLMLDCYLAFKVKKEHIDRAAAWIREWGIKHSQGVWNAGAELANIGKSITPLKTAIESALGST